MGSDSNYTYLLAWILHFKCLCTYLAKMMETLASVSHTDTDIRSKMVKWQQSLGNLRAGPEEGAVDCPHHPYPYLGELSLDQV